MQKKFKNKISFSTIIKFISISLCFLFQENITIRNENNNNPQDNSSCFLDTIYNWFKLL